MQKLIIFIAFLSLFSRVTCFEIWNYVHNCNISEDEELCNNSTYKNSRFTIYHTSVLSDSIFHHFIWTMFREPSVIIARTSKNCTLIVDYKSLILNYTNTSLLMKYDNETCDTLGSMLMLSIEEIVEMSDDVVICSYELSKNFINTTETVSSNYDIESILLFDYPTTKLELTIPHITSKQDIPPYFTLNPLNSLISVRISHMDIKSCDSTVAIKYRISSFPESTYSFQTTSNYFDWYEPGIYRANELTIGDIKSNQSGYFYWKDVSFSDNSRARSSFMSATSGYFTNCTISENSLNPFGYMNISQRCGEIIFKAINKETCFKSKSLIIWQGSFGFTSSKSKNMYPWIVAIISLIYVLPFMILTIFVITIYKVRRRRSGYVPIENDDSSNQSDTSL